MHNACCSAGKITETRGGSHASDKLGDLSGLRLDAHEAPGSGRFMHIRILWSDQLQKSVCYGRTGLCTDLYSFSIGLGFYGSKTRYDAGKYISKTRLGIKKEKYWCTVLNGNSPSPNESCFGAWRDPTHCWTPCSNRESRTNTAFHLCEISHEFWGSRALSMP